LVLSAIKELYQGVLQGFKTEDEEERLVTKIGWGAFKRFLGTWTSGGRFATMAVDISRAIVAKKPWNFFLRRGDPVKSAAMSGGEAIGKAFEIVVSEEDAGKAGSEWLEVLDKAGETSSLLGTPYQGIRQHIRWLTAEPEKTKKRRGKRRRSGPGKPGKPSKG
jgi:hypothetical protein